MKDKDNFIKLFLRIALGFLLLAVLFPFIINYFFSDWTESGTFGDTYGALNAIFSGLALAGVIVTILLQRTELNLQRDELKDTRKEFLLNRTTTVVYSQLDRFEKALNEFKVIIYNDNFNVGIEAIIKLSDFNTIFKLPKTDEHWESDVKNNIIKSLRIYTWNKTEIDKLAHKTYTSVEVLKRLIYKTDLEINQLNDLKNLFFVNIGWNTMDVIKAITEISALELEYLEEQDYINHKIKMGSLMNTRIFLRPIVDFYELHLTNENFDEHKSKWIEDVGILER